MSSSMRILPAELEKEIFETAAFFEPASIPTLLLVARRVKIWIEPLLLRVFSVPAPSSYNLRNFRHSFAAHVLQELFGKSECPTLWHPERVRHLLLHYSILHSILAECNNIVDLAIGSQCDTSTLLSLSLPFKLQHLSAPVAPFLLASDLSLPPFANITHLDVLDRATEAEGWSTWSCLAELPCLTHMSFHENFMPSSVCAGALEHCKSLIILAVLWPIEEARLATDYAYLHLDFEDPRFVMMVVPDLLEDWETGACGGRNYWDVADQLSRQRRSQGKEYMPVFSNKINKRTQSICQMVFTIEKELKEIDTSSDEGLFEHAQQISRLKEQVDDLRQRVTGMKHSAENLNRSKRLAALGII
ncbi:hypothetical protein FB45DRAFT_1027009 [Roridomyces roridus]|uniref:Uncharacterized protein n=1 Tax=Roridomyces roridus TaxID=1738132 RepID=A0AAD7FQT0_9AGAR|nr:hypothetical protein FB45DRAFT_1027009 [Roridomyces roridus]